MLCGHGRSTKNKILNFNFINKNDFSPVIIIADRKHETHVSVEDVSMISFILQQLTI